jgi:hypothetical protein
MLAGGTQSTTNINSSNPVNVVNSSSLTSQSSASETLAVGSGSATINNIDSSRSSVNTENISNVSEGGVMISEKKNEMLVERGAPQVMNQPSIVNQGNRQTANQQSIVNQGNRQTTNQQIENSNLASTDFQPESSPGETVTRSMTENSNTVNNNQSTPVINNIDTSEMIIRLKRIEEALLSPLEVKIIEA